MKKLYLETYGCQMNVADSEVVASILKDHNFEITNTMEQADVLLVNTCAIRENAEQRIWGRVNVFKQCKKRNPGTVIGVIGCMAERLKDRLLNREPSVDLLVGPDGYRELPKLIDTAFHGQKAVNTLLSKEETYADIKPVRKDAYKVSAFISIMRGCNNMCAYCVVPFTRGRERSRAPRTILEEVTALKEEGYKEITLIGQNVDSYEWETDTQSDPVTFADLLDRVARTAPGVRIRFATSHPKDMSNEVLYTIARHENICEHIHLPVQSGSTRILSKMNRGYTREQYMDRVNAIYSILPDCTITTDIITGFCSETEEDHQQTLSLIREVQFDFAFMFKYSERPNTKAARKYEDDVPDEIKSRRLNEIIAMQNKISERRKQDLLGKTVTALVDGPAKKSNEQLKGRAQQNQVVVFSRQNFHAGQYVQLKITGHTSATLFGEPVKETVI